RSRLVDRRSESASGLPRPPRRFRGPLDWCAPGRWSADQFKTSDNNKYRLLFQRVAFASNAAISDAIVVGDQSSFPREAGGGSTLAQKSGPSGADTSLPAFRDQRRTASGRIVIARCHLSSLAGDSGAARTRFRDKADRFRAEAVYFSVARN